MDKKKWAGWLVVALIVVVAAVALAMNNRTQAGAETDSVLQEALPTLKELFPEADDGGFERLTEPVESGGLQFAYKVKKGDETLGYAVKTTVEGYGGPIEVITGINADMALRGIRVGGSEFNETEDLGAKAKEPAFTDQFQGKTTPLTLGENIDAISGATVTSRAVTEGVNNAVKQLNSLLGAGDTSAAQSADGGRTANASAIGYGGPVLVRLTLDDAGAISALDIGGERFQETEGVGSRVREDAFIEQFIGKTPPLALGDGIDAASGATVSSQAVVDAVNEAAEFLK